MSNRQSFSSTSKIEINAPSQQSSRSPTYSQTEDEAPDKTSPHTLDSFEFKGLSESLKKQLAFDILSEGGLESANLNLICSKKLDVYGKPASVARRQIQNKVHQWKTSQRDEFNLIILSSSLNKPLPTHQVETKGLQPRTPSQRRRSVDTDISPDVLAPSQSPPVTAKMSAKRSSLLSAVSETVEVDWEYPENNGPLMIYRFSDLKKDEILHNGYILEVQDVDLRFMFGEDPSFSAYHLGGNEVVVKYPSTSYTFLNDAAVEEAGRRLAKVVDDRLTQTVDVARIDIAGDLTRKYKHILLKFPTKPIKEGSYDEIITNEVFSPKAENGKIKSIVVPLATKFKIADGKGEEKELSSYRSNIYWYLAIDEKVQRHTKMKTKKMNDLQDQVTDLVNGLIQAGLGPFSKPTTCQVFGSTKPQENSVANKVVLADQSPLAEALLPYSGSTDSSRAKRMFPCKSVNTDSVSTGGGAIQVYKDSDLFHRVTKRQRKAEAHLSQGTEEDSCHYPVLMEGETEIWDTDVGELNFK